MQTRSSDEKATCPSVRPSDKTRGSDKMEERYDQIFLPYERSFSLFFRDAEWLVGEGSDPFYLKLSTGLRWSEIADFELSQYSLVAAQP